jgi:hypothetical protein
MLLSPALTPITDLRASRAGGCIAEVFTVEPPQIQGTLKSPVSSFKTEQLSRKVYVSWRPFNTPQGQAALMASHPTPRHICDPLKHFLETPG